MEVHPQNELLPGGGRLHGFHPASGFLLLPGRVRNAMVEFPSMPFFTPAENLFPLQIEHQFPGG
jgi:hypothetical protein